MSDYADFDEYDFNSMRNEVEHERRIRRNHLKHSDWRDPDRIEFDEDDNDNETEHE